MEKFLRYIIILSTTALAVFLLYPFDEISRGRSTPKGFYSPVDGNIASQFVTAGRARYYWALDLERRNKCARNSAAYECKFHPFRINFYERFNDVVTFARKHPEFSEFNSAAEDFYSCIGKNNGFLGCPEDKISLLGEPVYEKYMDHRRKMIGIGTWIVNFCAAALIISLLIGRKSLGRSISNTLRSSRETIEDAAKKVHDKI